MSVVFDSGMQGDPSDAYANSHNFYIEFYSLVSDQSVAFKSWLEDWGDDFTSTWNPENVYGRMDAIQTFQRTTRVMNLGWKVIASSISEAGENMRRIQMLQKCLYPGYTTQNYTINGESTPIGTLARAPLFRVQFANWIMNAEGVPGTIDARQNGLLCSLNGLSVRPVAEDGYIDGDGSGGLKGQLFPKAWVLSTQLTILHEHFLGWDSSGNWIGAANYPYGQESTVSVEYSEGDTMESAASLAAGSAQNSAAIEAEKAGSVPAMDDEKAAEAKESLA